LSQAIADLHASAPVLRARAMAFLLDDTSSEFRWWCAVTGIDPDSVQRHARHLTQL
jgi:hypothetical protein